MNIRPEPETPGAIRREAAEQIVASDYPLFVTVQGTFENGKLNVDVKYEGGAANAMLLLNAGIKALLQVTIQ